MFVSMPPEFAFNDPWKRAFQDRYDALRRGGVRVAYYYDYPDRATFRYRVYNMLQVIGRYCSDVSASWFCFADGEKLDRIVDAADVLVICRSRYSTAVSRMISRARSLRRLVIYDIDDLVVDIDKVHLVVNSLGLDEKDDGVWAEWFSYVARLAAVMRQCDRVIVTNDYLAARIMKCGLPDVRVVPNCLNREQLSVSTKIFNGKLRSAFKRDGTITLGYFSGSASHRRDFALIQDTLRRVMKADRRIGLTVVGILDVGPLLSRFPGRIEHVAMQDYLNLQRFVGRAELNLVPLRINAFTNCKSELKYFEAAAVGTVTIASPAFALASVIQNDATGWLAGPGEWDERIGRAVAMLDDDFTSYRNLAERARADALARFSWREQTAAIRAALLDPRSPAPCSHSLTPAVLDARSGPAAL